ncbi:MAG: chaperone NapD [Gammaproteobacteria bacterium]|nr:chaperone NapD [Gammaproteobacteria bacterium]
MNLSGILIISTPSEIDALIDSLNAMPDVEVHHIDRDNNKLIVVQEAEAIHKEVDGLKKIKKLPGIVLAEMVYHYLADDKSLVPENIPDDLDEYTGLQQSAVPAYLND